MDSNKAKLAVFDFDGTLYKGDSFVDFCAFYYLKKPWRLWFFFIQLGGFLFWKLGLLSSSQFKSLFIQYLFWDSEMEIKRMSQLFWERPRNFNEIVIERLVFYQKEGYTILIASASPKLLIEIACLKLNVKHVVGTELIPYKKRHVVIKNCRGPEKLIQVKRAFPEHHLAVAYSDNKDDLELLHQAEQGFFVLGDGNIKPC